MKELAKYETEIGHSGIHAKGSVGVEASNLKFEVAVSGSVPLEKIIDPVMAQVDKLVDKLEALIPGYQTAMAAELKAETREAIVKALSEKPE